MKLGVWVILTVAGFAYADHLPLPGIHDGVADESAVKEIQSDIEDWTDERNVASESRKRDCFEAGIFEVLLPKVWLPMQSAEISSRLPQSVNSQVGSQDVSPDQMFAGVALTPAEKQQLLIIENHAAAAPEDRADVLIRLQKLSMSVTNRIFSYDIETARLMVSQASPPDAVVNRCQEEILRIERDTRMIAAAKELISLYSEGVTRP